MTHTFEIGINGFTIEGETQLGNNGSRIKITNGFDLSIDQVKRITELLDFCANMCQDYGDIKKIEIAKKV